jgi:hypothetical protein
MTTKLKRIPMSEKVRQTHKYHTTPKMLISPVIVMAEVPNGILFSMSKDTTFALWALFKRGALCGEQDADHEES